MQKSIKRSILGVGDSVMVSASLSPDSDAVLSDEIKYHYDKVTKYSHSMVKAMQYQACSPGDSHRPTAPSQGNLTSRRKNEGELI